MSSVHVPVLLKEVIEYLAIKPGSKIIDATISGGGHTKAILEKLGSGGRVLGIEWDPDIFNNLKLEDERLIRVNDSYVNLKKIAAKNNFEPDGILFDLGLSSWHYEGSGRGFSFKKNEILDMRFNPGHGAGVTKMINTLSEGELRDIISDLGEEQFASNIARNIIKARQEKPIIMTEELVIIIGESVPEFYKHQKIHYATKTFQALRVAVNDELGNVRKGVQGAIDILRPGGRLVVISFQGMEDKIVKEIFREKSKAGIVRLVVKGTIKPTWEEQKINPRSRSAKMKVVEKI